MKNAQAVEKIVPQLSFFDGGSRGTIGGGDHSNRDRNRGSSPDSPHLSFLENAEKLGLNFGRHLGDLVEEEGPAVRLLETTLVSLDGIGKGTLLVTEKLTLHQCGRDSRAVKRQKSFLAPR